MSVHSRILRRSFPIKINHSFFLVDEQILSLASLGLSCLALKKLARRKAFGNDTCQVKRSNVSNRVKVFMIRWYTNKAGLPGLLLISNSAEYSRYFSVILSVVCNFK